jgi:hypothetical protein
MLKYNILENKWLSGISIYNAIVPMLYEIIATQCPYRALHVLIANSTNYTGSGHEWFHL